jgi:hypothetical protein
LGTKAFFFPHLGNKARLVSASIVIVFLKKQQTEWLRNSSPAPASLHLTGAAFTMHGKGEICNQSIALSHNGNHIFLVLKQNRLLFEKNETV